MRILVIGSGGREHAIVRALSQEGDSLHAAPGNPGIAALAETHPDTAPFPDQIVRLARKLSPDLVVIGPEAPLVAGAADALRESGIACFGPDASAAVIEGSKSFAKQVMTEAGIPTAASITCTSDAEADQALAAFGPPYVVKDDALAAGKGVLVTSDLAAARAHARACGTVVIEEFLDGPEVSLFAVTDGVTGGAAAARPGLQARPRRRPRTEHRRHGRLRPAAVGPGRPGRTTMATRHPAGRRRHAPARHAVPRPAVRRPVPDPGRPAGGRVQRPLRRPGDAGSARPAGPGAPRWRRCCTPPRPATWPAPHDRPGGGPAPRWSW